MSVRRNNNQGANNITWGFLGKRKKYVNNAFKRVPEKTEEERRQELIESKNSWSVSKTKNRIDFSRPEEDMARGGTDAFAPPVSPTPSVTPSVTPTMTPTITPTQTITPTITQTQTPTLTPTPSATPPAAVFPDWSSTGNSSTEYFAALTTSAATYSFDITAVSGTPVTIGGNANMGVVMAPNGYAYTIPYSDTNMIKIDGSNPSTKTQISIAGGADKWAGGVLSTNGYIYAIPHSSVQVLKFDPSTDTFSLFGNLSGLRKYRGGVVADNGYIYCPPRNNSDVLKIDPFTDTTSTFGSISGSTNKYATATLAKNGMIYCAPTNNNAVLKIDPTTDTISYIPVSGGTNYLNGQIGIDGKVYMWNTNNGGDVLVVDPATDTYQYILIGQTQGRVFGSNMSPAGTLVSIASVDSGEGVYELDTSVPSISTFGTFSVTNDSAGLALLPSGYMVAAPFNTTTMRIVGTGGLSLPNNWILSRYINKL